MLINIYRFTWVHIILYSKPYMGLYYLLIYNYIIISKIEIEKYTYI